MNDGGEPSIQGDYALWRAGSHDELLTDLRPEFLSWAANYGVFDFERWRSSFLHIGALKREMWASVGKKPLPWCPIVELRMPWGCSASCSYCIAAKSETPLSTNSEQSVLRALSVLRSPETIALCAEWGDPCLHPRIIEAVNQRIEQEWLVTRYTVMTNFSSKDAVLAALPYTRDLLINFTMASPEHATRIMGYKKESVFERIHNHIKLACELRREGRCTSNIRLIYVVNQTTAPYISEHYRLFKDLDGLDCCRYVPAWGSEAQLPSEPAVIEQKRLLSEIGGRVRYGWEIY